MIDAATTGEEFPRGLTERERSWIGWVLPENRPAYRELQHLIFSGIVIGEGRRGKGEIILGIESDLPDFSAPLAPVFAYGVIETDAGAISITVREELDSQISVEIIPQRTEEVPVQMKEVRRWSYSEWLPGNPCPQCNGAVREVIMRTSGGRRFDLAICSVDKRLWISDEATGVNRLIPVTNYYNELMLHKNIRDPKIALDSNRFFRELSLYTDEELTYAFTTYNKLRMKVRVDAQVIPVKSRKSGMANIFSNMLRK